MIGGPTRCNLLAPQYRMSIEEKGKLMEMKRDVFEIIESEIKRLKPNKWKISRSADLVRGSLDKNTALRNSSDIDVVLVMNYKPLENQHLPSPKEILLKISSFVNKKYDVTVNPRTLTVASKNNDKSLYSRFQVRNNLTMDIVPALIPVTSKTDKPHWIYGISGSRNPGHWVKFSPKHQKEMADSLYKNRKHPHDSPSDLLVNLKKWRDDARNPPKKLPSYALEILVYKDYKEFPAEDSLDNRHKRIFKKIQNLSSIEIKFDEGAKPQKKKPVVGRGVIQDPSNVSQNIISHFSKEQLLWWERYAQISYFGGGILW
jgi:hypothetical protein